jgi:ribonuclease Z
VDNATAAPSVLLFFDKDRYLFNAGEGIQRHFIEHKQRLKKVKVFTIKSICLHSS